MTESECPLCGEPIEREYGDGPYLHSESQSLWCEDGRRGLDALQNVF
jgi:hypothetical protein